MKSFFAAVLGLMLSVQTVAAFSDVGASVPAAQQEAIKSLTDQGAISGYSDGTFRPLQNVNRAEFLRVLMVAANRNTSSSQSLRCFTDFIGTEQWYWAPACTAKNANLISGYPDGTFRGDRWVNTAEAVKIAVNAFGLRLPTYIRAPDHWYDPYMDTASGKGVFNAMVRDPNHLVTRAEMALIVQSMQGNPVACSGHTIGQSYKKDCNSCSCTANGEICTLMACPVPNCTSSNDCTSPMRCSTEWGECLSSCPPGQLCSMVCRGTCQQRLLPQE